MPIVIGLTGGVACGKSHFGRELSRRLGADYVEADRLAKAEMTHNVEVRDALVEAFGSAIFLPDASLDRKYVRELLFSSSEAKRTLEAIVHPAVKTRWKASVSSARLSGLNLVVEIPLLYEVKAEEFFDAVTVVASSEPLQLQRMIEKRGLCGAVARKILASQMPISDKVTRADHVIWNDSRLDFLMNQAAYFADLLSRPNV